MEQRKKVLITNLYFQKFTGSELHVLEFAHLFKEKGYDVVIAVYKKSYPLLQELEEGITVIECQKEALKEMEFEIVFIQHFPVFDYLVSRYGLKYKRMVVSKLSVINAMENLPVCTQEAAFILCVSPECADMVAMQVPEGTKIRVFQNCVEAEYFEGSGEYAGYKERWIRSRSFPIISRRSFWSSRKDGRVLSGGSDRTWVSHGTGECRVFAAV